MAMHDGNFFAVLCMFDLIVVCAALSQSHHKGALIFEISFFRCT